MENEHTIQFDIWFDSLSLNSAGYNQNNINSN